MIDYAKTFAESFSRVTADDVGERFFERFYERFVAADTAIAEKFASTDLENQKRMLRESLKEMRDFSSTHTSNIYLITLARIHGIRGHYISESFYDTWVDELVETVAEIDPEANDNIRLAWRIVMAPGITFMKFFRER